MIQLQLSKDQAVEAGQKQFKFEETIPSVDCLNWKKLSELEQPKYPALIVSLITFLLLYFKFFTKWFCSEKNYHKKYFKFITKSVAPNLTGLRTTC